MMYSRSVGIGCTQYNMPKQIKKQQNRKSLNSIESKSQSQERKALVAQSKRSGRNGVKPVVISGQERFADVTIADASEFTVAQRYLNPGNVDIFPWASKVCVPFEKYKFKTLKVHYVPVVPTSVYGQVSLAIDYNSSDRLPLSGEEMSQYARYVTGPVWGKMSFDLLSGKMNRQLFVTNATNPSTLSDHVSQLEYYLGKILISSESGTVNTVIGRLEVEYEVELYGRNFSASGFSVNGQSYFSTTPNTSITQSPHTITYLPSGSFYGSDDGPTITANGILVPPGTWKVEGHLCCSNSVDSTIASALLNVSDALWTRGSGQMYLYADLNSDTNASTMFYFASDAEVILTYNVFSNSPYNQTLRYAYVNVTRVAGTIPLGLLPVAVEPSQPGLLTTTPPPSPAKAKKLPERPVGRDWVKLDQESKEGRA